MTEQLKISLPGGLRGRLDAAVAKSGHTLSYEIRSRIERTFADDEVDRPTRELMRAVERLCDWVLLQTGCSWYTDPFTNQILRRAITARIARSLPENVYSAAPGNRPVRLIASDNPEEIGLGLEALDFRHEDDHELRKRAKAAAEESIQEILRQQKEGEKS